ncbi:MAG TPA: helix-turn-helix domain-containing protein [Nocardioidaceae bacterium]|nr:helix-turn-helix domain-containing protein [Nocardioidaceae bacterium]
MHNDSEEHSPGAGADATTNAGGGRWAELIRLLHADADTLVGEFLHHVRQIGPYAAEVVPPTRVEADAVASFDYLLRRIGGLPVSDRVQRAGPEIGRDRARRGVPLEDLATAVRLDFRVLWNALRDRAGPDDVGLLVARVEDVWAVVEDYTSTIQVAYLEEAARMAREQRRERSTLVAHLLASIHPEPADVHRVALALGVEETAPMLVAAAPAPDRPALRGCAELLAASGRAVHVQEEREHSLLLTRWLGSQDPDGMEPGAVMAALGQSVRCGVGPVARGVAQLPASAHLATAIADALPANRVGPHTLRQAWLWLAGARLGSAAAELAAPIRAGLASARSGEQDRLLETVLAYTACGSVQQAADRLYCHRNTVVNRLRRFAELTGCDVTVPDQAVLVQAALSWQECGVVALHEPG